MGCTGAKPVEFYLVLLCQLRGRFKKTTARVVDHSGGWGVRWWVCAVYADQKARRVCWLAGAAAADKNVEKLYFIVGEWYQTAGGVSTAGLLNQTLGA